MRTSTASAMTTTRAEIAEAFGRLMNVTLSLMSSPMLVTRPPISFGVAKSAREERKTKTQPIPIPGSVSLRFM